MSSITPPKKLTVHEQTLVNRKKVLEIVNTPGTVLSVVGGIAMGLGILSLIGYLNTVVLMPLLSDENPFDTTIEKSEDLSTEEKEQKKNEKMFEVATKVGWIGIVSALQLICILGAALTFVAGMHMRKLKSYRWAMTGCVISLVPLLSPFVILGIPLGVWGIMTLRKPEVAKAFGG